jgi:hypothetical protein
MALSGDETMKFSSDQTALALVVGAAIIALAIWRSLGLH